MHGIQPDLTKGLANGFPLSALAGRREIMRLGGPAEDRDRVFLLSQTYGGQPWALAAMLATIGVHEREDVVGGLHRTGAALRAGSRTRSRGGSAGPRAGGGAGLQPGVCHQGRVR